jgi:transglutaminase-like putative cysteine protease
VPNYSLKISPANHFINWQQDPYGNWLARIVFPIRSIISRLPSICLPIWSINPFDFFVEEYAETYPFARGIEGRSGRLLRDRAQGRCSRNCWPVHRHEGRTIDFLVAINQAVNRRVLCHPHGAGGAGAGGNARSRHRIVPRFGWLLVHLLRRLGFAARFVSGYSIQLTPMCRRRRPAGVRRTCDLHAWTEVYVPGAGWIGWTRPGGCLRAKAIFRCATPHYRTAAPIEGVVMEPVHSDFHFEMKVSRIAEAVRITKPFTDERWDALMRWATRSMPISPRRTCA